MRGKKKNRFGFSWRKTTKNAALATTLATFLAPAGMALAAGAEMKLPPCDGLVAWGKSINPHETYNVAPRIAVPRALEEPGFSGLFGLPALAWTQQDFAAAKKGVGACYWQARKRRDRASVGALVAAGRALDRQLPYVIAKLQRSKAAAEAAKKTIDALPDSPELGSGIEILVKGNPAAPDMNPLRGLPRNIAEAVYHLARIVPDLADGERETMFEELAARRTKIEAAVTDTAEKAIAAAPADADGILALMEERPKLDDIADAATRARLGDQLEQRIKQVRDALHQAKPAVWIPPECMDLYRWANAPGATQNVELGRGNILGMFGDNHVLPVFGTSLADWTDEDLARFRTLSDYCRSEVGTLKRQAAHGGALTPEQNALLKAGGHGDWALDPSRQSQLVSARKALLGHRQALARVQEMTATIVALPDTDASLVQLNQMRSEPALSQVARQELTPFVNAYNTKLAAVGAQEARVAIKGLAQIKVAELADLNKLQTYATNAAGTLRVQRAQANFRSAYERSMHDAAVKLLPQFQAELDAIPLNPEGIEQARTALAKLTGIRDQPQVPGLQPLREAAAKRVDVIIKGVREQTCKDLLAAIGARGDAGKPVWDGNNGVALGQLLCGLAEHGLTISGYTRGEPSGTASFEVSAPHEALRTVSMHEAEVQPGKKMLVGYELKDPNQVQKLTVDQWVELTGTADPRAGIDTSNCKQFESMDPDKVPAGARPYLLECALHFAGLGNRGR